MATLRYPICVDLGGELLRGNKKSHDRFPPITVPKLFQKTAGFENYKTALSCKEDGNWVTCTWNDYLNLTKAVAKSLIGLNVKQHEVVFIMGFNSVEWFTANEGSIFAGAVPAGIYPTNGEDIIEYQCKHTKARVAIIDEQSQLKKFLNVRNKKIDGVFLEHLIIWGGDKPTGEENVYTWNEFINLGKPVEDTVLDSRIEEQKPGHCCTLIYTSGTTGFPKAVMLSHDNITWTARTIAEESGIPFDEDDAIVSYLPLSHIAAQMVDIYSMMVTGGSVSFAQKDALKGSLVNTLREVQPTIFFGVPRVWEKMEEKMREIGKNTTGLKRMLVDWAKGKGDAATLADEEHGWYPWFYYIANYFIFSKVKRNLGLSKAKVCCTAAAPIKRSTMDFFAQFHIPLLEAYGMSESAGPETLSVPYNFRRGSVGLKIPGTILRIVPPIKYHGGPIIPENNDEPNPENISVSDTNHDPELEKLSTRQNIESDENLQKQDELPDDPPEIHDSEYDSSVEEFGEYPANIEGEICWAGRNIMMGYLDNVPASKEAIDDRGYLHSGDLGKKDEDGFLHITGRIKEILITAGGENIPPVPIEDSIKDILPCLSNVMLIGDQRKYLTCLVTLKTTVDETQQPTNKLTGPALEIPGSNATTIEEAQTDKAVDSHITEGIKEANKRAISRAYSVQKYRILSKDFTIEGGELTNTMKVKRRVIYRNCIGTIEEMYKEE